MNTNEFNNLINDIISYMRTYAQSNPNFYTDCRSGDDFELCVVAAVNHVLQDQNIAATIHHTPGSHAFPDIVIESPTGEKYGIEVKSSKSNVANNWTINGNSVMGSTSDHEVIETYVVFGKLSPSVLNFRAKKYQDCISKVVVTHSPRYFIDMDIPEDETFFAKSGISYSTIVNSDNPISLITNYYRDEGMQAWWLAESTPAALQLFSDLEQDEQDRLIGYGFAHYPELFSNSNKKYRRFALWLATEESIISPCLRDDFSASGKVNITLDGNPYLEIPRMFKVLMENREHVIAELDIATCEKLAEDWNVEIPPNLDINSKIDIWIDLVSSKIMTTRLDRTIDIPQMLRRLLLSN